MTDYIMDSRQLNFNSKDAISLNGTMKSSLLFNLANILKITPDVLYCQISLTHAEIPVSYFLINSSNNVLKYSIGATNYSIVLTNGNYNSNSFITMLIGLMGVNWSMSLNSITGSFTLNYIASFAILTGSTCYKFLGMLENTTYNSSSFKIIFPFPCNFAGISVLKLKSNILNTKSIDSNQLTSQIPAKTICSIPVNNSYGGIISFINQFNFKSFIQNININNIDFTLCDEYDNLIDLNNQDWNFTITLDITRRPIFANNSLEELFKTKN